MRALSWEDIHGNTPLMIAAKNNHSECVELVIPFKIKRMRNDIQLLEHGANVFHCSRGEDGGTALHLAISNHASPQIIELLLNYRKLHN